MPCLGPFPHSFGHYKLTTSSNDTSFNEAINQPSPNRQPAATNFLFSCFVERISDSLYQLHSNDALAAELSLGAVIFARHSSYKIVMLTSNKYLKR